ncbi:MAG: hypothetical protein P4L31_04840 [Candidatus Babeliales bacterium]|nr:hypothetical protein [Candidatus Babeliales bacterium]
MALHISLLPEGALKLLSLETVDIIIIPITDALNPYLASGENLYEEANENKIADDFLKKEADSNKVYLTLGHGLLKKKVKFLIHKVVSFDASKEANDIKAELVAYYKASLEKALTKNFINIAISFINYHSDIFSLEDSVRIAIAEIQKYSNEHPNIKVNFIFEDELSFNIYLKIKDTLNLDGQLSMHQSVHSDEEKYSNPTPSSTRVPLTLEAEDSEDEESKEHGKIQLIKSRAIGHHQLDYSSFQCAPVTPVGLEGKLRRVKVEKRSLPAVHQRWEEFAIDHIMKVLCDPKSHLEGLKFLLGPSLGLIQRHYEGGDLKRLEWNRYKLQCKKSYYTLALDGIEIYKKYLEHKKIFSADAEDFENPSQEFKKSYEDMKEIYSETMGLGLVAYKKLIVKKLFMTYGREFQKKWEEKKDAASYKLIDLEDKKHFEESLERYLDDWSKDESVKQSQSNPRMLSIFRFLLNDIKKAIFIIVTQEKDLQEISQEINFELSKISDELVKLEQEIDGQQIQYETALAVEIESYRALVNKWLSNDGNYQAIYAKVIVADEHGYLGTNPKGLIDIIIEYNSGENPVDNRNAAIGFYRKLREEKGYRQAFQVDLRKHFFDVDFESHVDHAIKLHQGMREQKEHAETNLDERIKNALLLMASNTRTWLESSIANPLEWHELTQLLTLIACKSEAQQSLKLKLQTYIDSRDPKLHYSCYLAGFNNSELFKRRRQVGYLISCLYIASALQIDERVLFDLKKDQYKNFIVGVDLILENMRLDKITSSRLKVLLEEFLAEVSLRKVVYLDLPNENLSNPMLEASLSAIEIVQLATQRLELEAPVYECQPLYNERPAEFQKIMGLYRSPTFLPQSRSINHDRSSLNRSFR